MAHFQSASFENVSGSPEQVHKYLCDSRDNSVADLSLALADTYADLCQTISAVDIDSSSDIDIVHSLSDDIADSLASESFPETSKTSSTTSLPRYGRTSVEEDFIAEAVPNCLFFDRRSPSSVVSSSRYSQRTSLLLPPRPFSMASHSASFHSTPGGSERRHSISSSVYSDDEESITTAPSSSPIPKPTSYTIFQSMPPPPLDRTISLAEVQKLRSKQFSPAPANFRHSMHPAYRTSGSPESLLKEGHYGSPPAYFDQYSPSPQRSWTAPNTPLTPLVESLHLDFAEDSFCAPSSFDLSLTPLSPPASSVSPSDLIEIVVEHHGDTVPGSRCSTPTRSLSEKKIPCPKRAASKIFTKAGHAVMPNRFQLAPDLPQDFNMSGKAASFLGVSSLNEQKFEKPNKNPLASMGTNLMNLKNKSTMRLGQGGQSTGKLLSRRSSVVDKFNGRTVSMTSLISSSPRSMSLTSKNSFSGGSPSEQKSEKPRTVSRTVILRDNASTVLESIVGVTSERKAKKRQDIGQRSSSDSADSKPNDGFRFQDAKHVGKAEKRSS